MGACLYSEHIYKQFYVWKLKSDVKSNDPPSCKTKTGKHTRVRIFLTTEEWVVFVYFDIQDAKTMLGLFDGLKLALGCQPAWDPTGSERRFIKSQRASVEPQGSLVFGKKKKKAEQCVLSKEAVLLGVALKEYCHRGHSELEMKRM